MATKAAPRGRGQPPWQPTEKERGAVQALSGVGYGEELIGQYIGKDLKTIRKHCARELDFATMELLGAAWGKLAAAIKRGESWAICFVLKTKGKALGWTERYEHSGPNGDGIPLRLESLNDAQLNTLIERIEAALRTRGA